MISKIRNSSFTKAASVLLLALILFPAELWSITNGPSQPEFTSFTQADTNDMVDLFTGDFQYNIPLLDVEGYPVNLSYSAGIGMEDQASCVGLGWTLNAAGIINRTVRGLPDDFNGDDKIVTTTYFKPNWTVGANLTLGNIEIIGLPLVSFDLGFGVLYNNYTGFGYEKSVGVSVCSGDKFKFGGNLTLGISGDNGISLSPSVNLGYSVSQGIGENESGAFSGNLRVGTSLNSRSGLRQVSISASASQTKKKFDAGMNRYRTTNRNSIGHSTSIPIGLVTYVPQMSQDMKSYSMAIDFGVGLEAYWVTADIKLDGYFSRQALADSKKESPAYGYLYSEKGKSNKSAMHDFNREKDGLYTKNTPALPMTQMTYDIYTVSGQGIKGMFRPFRDFGTVYDPYMCSVSGDGDLGFDLAAGWIIKGGMNAGFNYNESTSGWWSDGHNASRNALSFSGKDASNPIYENVYFKNAGEFTVIDREYYENIQGVDPVRVDITKEGKANATFKRRSSLSDSESSRSITGNNRNYNSREKRSLVMSYLTAEEAKVAGFEKKMHHYPLNENMTEKREIDRVGDGRLNHHISEITVNSPDGTRYIYGSQTYNYHQEEVTFNVRKEKVDDNVKKHGFVNYEDSDNDIKNKNGLNHYYNKNVVPAHATAYQMTAILSSDYVDVKADGPTPDDLGSYTKFNYTRLDKKYNWRNPYGGNIGIFSGAYANFQEGLRCKNNDDKGAYLYGEKEIKLLHSIETKNYVAKFYYSPREDAYDVAGKNGGRGGNPLYKLDEIKLFSRQEYFDTDPQNPKKGENATVLKAVHFDYDYSLCPGIPSSSNGGGKLTLKKVWFTYEGSQKGTHSPYEFTYGTGNPGYHPREQDRWGNYMPAPASNTQPVNIDAPYVKQNRVDTDQYAMAWCLTEINLPAGGTIKVDYESDDYAYVQDVRATDMIKVTGFGSQKNDDPNNKLYDNFGENRNFIFFDAPDGSDFKQKYIGNMNKLFFKFYIDLTNEDKEYIMGYADIKSSGWENGRGYIELQDVDAEEPSGRLNPIAKEAMQFIRIHVPDLFYGGNNQNDLEKPGEEIFRKIAGNITDMNKLLQGIHMTMCQKSFCKNVDLNKSFIRLQNPDYAKLGGGHRVKKITVNDGWKEMSGSSTESADYGQEYFYTRKADVNDPGIPAGAIISSGVASYEPFIGGEENPLRSPDRYTNENKGNPDDHLFLERPYGEMFYPSPTVGYSRVVVKNLRHPDEKPTDPDPEYTEYEFYTAKDFPIITREPKLVKEPYKTPWIQNIFNINVQDYMTTSQSYAIELNDMHGKPKSEKVYAKGQSTPISEVEYFYKKQNPKQLDNEITTINKSGNVEYGKLAGINIDMVTDERESSSYTVGGYVHANLDASPIPFPPIPLPLPPIWGGGHSETTRFRSIANTKVITRYGILEKIRTKEFDSEVTTENLAWDEETGEVLLTRTQNSFGDPLYSFTYPAHWGYDNMAAAYRNIGLSGKFKFSNIPSGDELFAVGDELYMKEDGQRGWVKEVKTNSIHVEYDNGGAVAGNVDKNIIVVRSGRRNQQSTPVGVVTTLNCNPINDSNLTFDNVLNAGAVEFNSNWDKFCDESNNSPAKNSFLRGETGNPRPWRSYLYLTGRSQSEYNRSTNIRRDGTFESFTPFWKPNYGKDWIANRGAWTSASEVTLASPYGFELENRDALDRYTSASYGYKNTIPTAVTSNSPYKEMGFTGFEDALMNTGDDHFGFDKYRSKTYISEEQSHTGRNSIKVGTGDQVEMEKILTKCDK